MDWELALPSNQSPGDEVGPSGFYIKRRDFREIKDTVLHKRKFV